MHFKWSFKILELNSISSTNIRLKSLPDRDKSNQNTGPERRPVSSVKGRRQKKVNLVVYLIYSSYACIVSSLIILILNPFMGYCFQNSLVIEYECLCPRWSSRQWSVESIKKRSCHHSDVLIIVLIDCK